MPRYHRVEDIIQLALALQVPGPGLCLEDIQERFGVGRRTAERMREAVDRLYPGLTSTKGGDGRKYWRLPAGEANGLVSWQRDELDALAGAIRDARGAGDVERARVLATLHDKVEALAGAEGTADAPAAAVPTEGLKRAIVLGCEVRMGRRRGDGERVVARVKPYGLLGGPRPLLVAVPAGGRRPRLVAVDDVDEVELLDAVFERDSNIDLRRYAANAFLPFEEGPVELCWRFAPESADDVLEYEFDPEQQIDHRDDGGVVVRFHAESLVEAAWHVFAWGDRIEAMELPVLKHRFSAMMRRALEARPRSAEAHPDPAEARES